MNFMPLPSLRSLFFGVSFATLAAAPGFADEPGKWGPHLDIEGRWGEGRALGDVGIFAPLWQSQTSLFFADVRLKYDNRDSMEGNFGLGLRHMLSSGWNLGTYGYFDRRRSGSGSYFNQATLGIEALSADFDLRANGYIPFGKTTRDLGLFGGGAPYAELANGTIEVVSTPGLARRYESALTGADAEMGWRLPVLPAESLAQFRAYAGGYWFDGGGLVDDIYGPRGRLELSFDDALGVRGARFTLGGEVQHDKLRGTQGYAMARLRIPLQAADRAAPKLSAQEMRMTERVVRDVDVVTGGHETVLVEEVREAAINRYNSQTVTSAVQVDAASGHAALQTALANHFGVSGGVVILNGSLTGLSTQTQAWGTLLGGGAVLPVEGAVSGTQVNFIAPGAAGSLSSAVNGMAVLAMVGPSGVAGGLIIENTASVADGIVSLTRVTVFGNRVTTAGDDSYGIRLGTDSTAIGNVIQTGGAGAHGIYFGTSVNVTANGNVIHTTGAGAHGIYSASVGGAANGNVIQTSGAGGHGILFTINNGTANGNVISTAGANGDGVHVLDSITIGVVGNEFREIAGAAIGTSGFAGGFIGSTGNTWTGQGGGVLCNRSSTSNSGTVSFTDIDGNGTPGSCPP